MAFSNNPPPLGIALENENEEMKGDDEENKNGEAEDEKEGSSHDNVNMLDQKCI